MMKMKIFEEEYTNITIEDDDEMALIKEAIKSLTTVQRKIYLTYCENMTYTATAKIFGVSIPTVKTYLDRITKIIIKYVFDNIK